MSVAQGYVYCGCLTAAICGIALLMIYMGVFRRGDAAELDDGAAKMLIGIGGALLAWMAVIWAIGLSDKFH
jgi:hypothetical protein